MLGTYPLHNPTVDLVDQAQHGGAGDLTVLSSEGFEKADITFSFLSSQLDDRDVSEQLQHPVGSRIFSEDLLRETHIQFMELAQLTFVATATALEFAQTVSPR